LLPCRSGHLRRSPSTGSRAISFTPASHDQTGSCAPPRT
jgi:hypothetical protein